MDRNAEIAKIAYELYIRRQGAPGDPQSDWLVAERIFAEREGLENQETPTTQNLETAASAGTIKRPRVRAKSNGSSGSSKSETASSERSSVKSKIDKIVTETTPRKKRTTNK